MRNVLMLVLVICTVSVSRPTQAQQLLEQYQALLSEKDHFSSSGQRLTSAAAVIRQDRANFHRFGLRDQADENDRFFANIDNRSALEKLIERGRAEPGVISSIVNGTPLVRVEVWRGNAGPFVVVTLVAPSSEEPQATECVVADPTGTPLNVRTVPNGQIIGTLQNGVFVRVIKESTDRNQKPWGYVADQTGRPLGWVFREFIVCASQGTKASPPSGASPEQAPGANETKIGTGFYVSDDGYLITNEHVVNSCNKFSVIDLRKKNFQPVLFGRRNQTILRYSR